MWKKVITELSVFSSNDCSKDEYYLRKYQKEILSLPEIIMIRYTLRTIW